jgi:DNA polymerase alpha-associated DNA helicase A
VALGRWTTRRGLNKVQAGDHLQLPPTIKSLNESRKDRKKSSKTKSDKKAKGATTKEGQETTNGQADDDESKQAESMREQMEEAAIDTNAEKNKLKLKPPSTLETTLFDRLLKLHGSRVKRALNVQYRMHEKIMQFPSDAMYGGSLIAADSVKARRLSDLEGIEPNEELDEPVVFIDSLFPEFCSPSYSLGLKWFILC